MITITVFPQKEKITAAERNQVKTILGKAVKDISLENVNKGIKITAKEKQIHTILKAIYRSDIQWYTTDEELEEQYFDFVSTKQKRKKKVLNLVKFSTIAIVSSIITSLLVQIAYGIAEKMFHSTPVIIPLWQYYIIFLSGGLFGTIVSSLSPRDRK